jgi:hypothetical protein
LDLAAKKLREQMQAEKQELEGKLKALQQKMLAT